MSAYPQQQDCSQMQYSQTTNFIPSPISFNPRIQKNWQTPNMSNILNMSNMGNMPIMNNIPSMIPQQQFIPAFYNPS